MELQIENYKDKHEYISENGIRSVVYLMDCLDGLKQIPDKYFELAIVDPPYGIGISSKPVRQQHKKKEWDDNIPNDKYFDYLFSISINQIIWGGNYFGLPPTQGFIIWDKVQPEKFSLAMCEYAWSSMQSPAKMWKRSVLAEQDKIHPTQKPVALYEWIIKNYAKESDKILDTHLGSGSSRIAAHKANLPFMGFELDEDYFKASVKRFEQYVSQTRLF
jgi:DNA modification methylase